MGRYCTPARVPAVSIGSLASGFAASRARLTKDTTSVEYAAAELLALNTGSRRPKHRLRDKKMNPTEKKKAIADNQRTNFRRSLEELHIYKHFHCSLRRDGLWLRPAATLPARWLSLPATTAASSCSSAEPTTKAPPPAWVTPGGPTDSHDDDDDNDDDKDEKSSSGVGAANKRAPLGPAALKDVFPAQRRTSIALRFEGEGDADDEARQRYTDFLQLYADAEAEKSLDADAITARRRAAGCEAFAKFMGETGGADHPAIFCKLMLKKGHDGVEANLPDALVQQYGVYTRAPPSPFAPEDTSTFDSSARMTRERLVKSTATSCDILGLVTRAIDHVRAGEAATAAKHAAAQGQKAVAFSKGAFACLMFGDWWRESQWNAKVGKSSEEDRYSFGVEIDGKRYVLDTYSHESLAKYINDYRRDSLRTLGCSKAAEAADARDKEDMNCEFQAIFFGNRPVIGVVITKDVLEGEQLRIDYTEAYWREFCENMLTQLAIADLFATAQRASISASFASVENSDSPSSSLASSSSDSSASSSSASSFSAPSSRASTSASSSSAKSSVKRKSTTNAPIAAPTPWKYWDSLSLHLSGSDGALLGDRDLRRSSLRARMANGARRNALAVASSGGVTELSIAPLPTTLSLPTEVQASTASSSATAVALSSATVISVLPITPLSTKKTAANAKNAKNDCDDDDDGNACSSCALARSRHAFVVLDTSHVEQRASEIFGRLEGCFGGNVSAAASPKVRECAMRLASLHIRSVADRKKATKLVGDAISAMLENAKKPRGRANLLLGDKITIGDMIASLPDTVEQTWSWLQTARLRVRSATRLVSLHPIFRRIDLVSAKVSAGTLCDCAVHLSNQCNTLLQSGRAAYDAKFGEGAFAANEAYFKCVSVASMPNPLGLDKATSTTNARPQSNGEQDKGESAPPSATCESSPCKKCGYRFKHADRQVAQAMREYHEKYRGGCTGEANVCSLCGLRIARASHLERHRAVAAAAGQSCLARIEEGAKRSLARRSSSSAPHLSRGASLSGSAPSAAAPAPVMTSSLASVFLAPLGGSTPVNTGVQAVSVLASDAITSPSNAATLLVPRAGASSESKAAEATANSLGSDFKALEVTLFKHVVVPTPRVVRLPSSPSTRRKTKWSLRNTLSESGETFRATQRKWRFPTLCARSAGASSRNSVSIWRKEARVREPSSSQTAPSHGQPRLLLQHPHPTLRRLLPTIAHSTKLHQRQLPRL